MDETIPLNAVVVSGYFSLKNNKINILIYFFLLILVALNRYNNLLKYTPILYLGHRTLVSYSYPGTYVSTHLLS